MAMTSPATTTVAATPNILSDSETVSDSVSTLRKTKRKLDDAFQTLDNAVGPNETQRPPPPKRLHTIRSLYSTLAKYGIKTKEPSLALVKALHLLSSLNEVLDSAPAQGDSPITPKGTPHLTAILARAAARTRKALPKFSSSSAPSLSPTADYRPSSLPAFLLRLSTFKLATYANKPSSIDAVAASKCGWINDGKDRLVCGLCKNSWVVSGRDGMNRDAASALLEKQQTSLVGMHKDGCPWKTRQCDPTIYHIPLQSPVIMVNEVKMNAIKLEPLMHNIEIKHPLTSVQLSSLQSTLNSFVSPLQADTDPDVSDQQDNDVFTSTLQSSSDLTSTAILTSLFGWSVAPVALSEPNRLTSVSRANSLVPSTPRGPRTPSLSRASSIQPMSPGPTSPAQPGTPTRVPSSQFTFRMQSSVSSKHDTTLLHCALCQRRVGLWAFAPRPPTTSAKSPSLLCDSPPVGGMAADRLDIPASSTGQAAPEKAQPLQRQFDLLKEHRSYCPYVVRSTTVPTLPVPSPPNTSTSSNIHVRSNSVASQTSRQNGGGSAMEGWRAVLTVVLRYGMAQRQRLGLDFVERLRGNPADNNDEPMEVDNIKAMVAGVKSRGGKDLLQYVKGLLS